MRRVLIPIGPGALAAIGLATELTANGIAADTPNGVNSYFGGYEERSSASPSTAERAGQA
jgi:hypothetical protein